MKLIKINYCIVVLNIKICKNINMLYIYLFKIIVL